MAQPKAQPKKTPLERFNERRAAGIPIGGPKIRKRKEKA